MARAARSHEKGSELMNFSYNDLKGRTFNPTDLENKYGIFCLPQGICKNCEKCGKEFDAIRIEKDIFGKIWTIPVEHYCKKKESN